MPATLYSDDHERLVRMLREHRERAGMRQQDLATKLGRPQSFVSKYESGQRRLDLVEVAAICDALGVSLLRFVQTWVAKPNATRTGAE